MTVAIDPSRLVVDGEAAQARLTTRIRLGMPHLCLGGLSETWLLKACGDLHWRMLADRAGLGAPDFRDESGAKVYPAFCAVSAEGLGLDRFEEHDELRVVSELFQVSRTRFASVHRIMRGSEAVGSLELLSTFVKREVAGRNRSIARTALPAFAAAALARAPDLRVTRLSATLRKGDWDEHRGFRRIGSGPVGSTVLRPCPSQDFNGAALLYFAAYQGLADRAEWQLLGLSSHVAPIGSREIVFHSNAEPGERLRFDLRDLHEQDRTISHWISVVSEDDGRLLAEFFTIRRLLVAHAATQRVRFGSRETSGALAGDRIATLDGSNSGPRQTGGRAAHFVIWQLNIMRRSA